MREQLGPLEGDVAAATSQALELVPRVWERDHTVWQDDPTEVADRLGWLDAPSAFAEHVGDLRRFADGVVDDDLDHVVLVGMGGSSLYPDVLARSAGAAPGWPALSVLDSTAPAAVRRVRDGLPWDRTLLVASSKSGTTIETRSHLAAFWDVLREVRGDTAGRAAVAVTDPGSELARLGHDRGFRAVFENPPDIGGRFSALSYFGMVPAALLGLDLARHLAAAQLMADRARRGDEDNPPARLGAVLAAAARAGRDKLTVVLPDEVAAFGDWIEQLVAESTGKRGTGILPVVGEPLGDPGVYGDDRVFVAYAEHAALDRLAADGHPVIRLDPPAVDDLGAEAFRWEFATAVAGALLDLNPFDQPDVAAAKTATSRVLEAGSPELPTEPAAALLDEVTAGDHVAILAFVDPEGTTAAALPAVAAALRDRLGVPVTVGTGPRYLHSTGQLHKGGPDRGVYLLVLEDEGEDVPIPGERYGFSTLFRAQAAGDLEALRERGRRAGRVATADLLALAAG